MEAVKQKKTFKETMKDTGNKAKAYAKKQTDKVKQSAKRYGADIRSAYDVGYAVDAFAFQAVNNFALAVTVTAPPDRVVLVVGPEGGVSGEELRDLTAAGAVAVVLGPEGLRTSTAAAVALGALGVLTPRWSDPGTTLDPSDPSTRK